MADGGRGETNDGAGKNSGDNFDREKYREELKVQFEKLYQKDKYLPAALT